MTVGLMGDRSNDASRRLTRAKLIIAGDAAAGKSAICQVFHSDGAQFPKAYAMTTGVDLLTKYVNSPSNGAVELFLYDSPGKEIFSEVIMKCWDQPRLMMIVYDVTDETSFSSCSKWVERVRRANGQGNLIGVVVANKIDLADRRVVTTEAGEEFAKSMGLAYFEVSAKSQEVNKPFQHLVDEYSRITMEEEQES